MAEAMPLHLSVAKVRGGLGWEAAFDAICLLSLSLSLSLCEI
jgi:hypothetical protein